MDDFTHECLGLVVATSLSGLPIGRDLDWIVEFCGYPRVIVSNNRTGPTSHVILR